MKNLIFIGMLVLVSSCANWIKTDHEYVRVMGAPNDGTTTLVLPNGSYALNGGQSTMVIIPRSRKNFEASVVCPNGVKENILVLTKFDWMFGGLGNILTYGVGWIFDPFSDRAYDVENINLLNNCVASRKG